MSKYWRTPYWKTREQIKKDLFEEFRKYSWTYYLLMGIVGSSIVLGGLIYFNTIINAIFGEEVMPLYWVGSTIIDWIVLLLITGIPILFFVIFIRLHREFKINERVETKHEI